jgi:hypothetical protein
VVGARRWLPVGLAVLVSWLGLLGSARPAAAARVLSSAVRIARTGAGRPIPSGFIGLSLEFNDLESYAGTAPASLDPAFVQLLRDISPGQPGVLRIGGTSTDWTWWPVSGMRQPPSIRFVLSARWLAVARALTEALPARLIVGINLELDRRHVAAVEAEHVMRGVGRGGIEALELGNEPELYGSQPWYTSSSGHNVYGRSKSYGLAQYVPDFDSVAGALSGFPLAGPAIGGVNTLRRLGWILGHEPRAGLATIHAYPLRCSFASPSVNLTRLLSPASSSGFAAFVRPFVQAAHNHGRPIRIDEMNGISCGGQEGVSNTFGSALWVLDSLFELARAGVNGVSIHTHPSTVNEVLAPVSANGQRRIQVRPEYYGMMMFARAAPAGSRLIPITGARPAGVKVWATRTGSGVTRVLVINKRESGAETIRLHMRGVRGDPAVEDLRAPGPAARSGVTLGGQSFGSATATGRLSGPGESRRLRPHGGAYVIEMPPASASLLTFPRG